MSDQFNYFPSTVGDDIPVYVSGDYSQPDRTCGYYGSFSVTHVWARTDPHRTNIYSLIRETTEERLESEGMKWAQRNLQS